MSGNRFQKYAAPQPPPAQPENRFAKYGPVSQQPFEIEKPLDEYAQERFNAPLTDRELNMGRSVALANNVPFGDEALAAIGHPVAAATAAVGGDSAASRPYYDELDTAREMEARYNAQRPGEALAVSTVPGLVGFGGAGLYTAAPATAANVGTPVSRSLFGLVSGAGVGGVYGYGAGEGDVGDRLWEGAKGAGIGATVGATVPWLATGVGNLYGAAVDAVTANPQLRRLGLSRPGADMVENAFRSDDINGGALANIRAAGPHGMVADAGPNTAKVLDTVTQSPGPAVARAQAAVEGRAGQANQALQTEFDRRLGGPVQGVESRQQALRVGSQPAREQAYRAAYAAPIDYAAPEGRAIEGLMPRVPHEAINQANRLMRAEGHASRQIRVNVADDGTVMFERMPDVRQLDYITRGLNAVADGAEGQGAMRGTTDVGRAYQSLSRQIRGYLRQAVPEYGHALDTAADPIQRIQALEFGASVLRKGTTRDSVEMELQGMSAAERTAVAQGIRAHLDEVIDNVRRAASDPNYDARQAMAGLREVSSDAARDKIAAVIGDQNAHRLFNQADQAMRAFELRARVAENSKTATRLMTQRVMDAHNEPGAIGLALEGEIPKATKRMISTATGSTPQARIAQDQRIFDEIAQALTGPRGPAAERYMQDLLTAQRRRMLTRQTAANTVASGRWMAPVAVEPARKPVTGR